jgi:hypothetical protein
MSAKLRHAWIAMHRIPGSLVFGVLLVGLTVAAWIGATLSRGGPPFRVFFAIAVTGGALLAAIRQFREKASGEPVTGWRDGRTVRFNRWHPGLLFVIGLAVAVLIGAPRMWYFFAAAIGGGVVIAIVLQRMHDRSGAPPGVT